MALSRGAVSLGYPGVTHGVLFSSEADLVNHFYSQCNKNLVEYMKHETQDPSKTGLIPESIRNAVEARLRMIEPYLSTWPQALAILALPPNIQGALTNLTSLVDDICYYAGDKSVDFNWYSRRTAVAGIYKATELYFVQDESQDHNATWSFLERRLEEVLQVQTTLETTGKAVKITYKTIAALVNFMRKSV